MELKEKPEKNLSEIRYYRKKFLRNIWDNTSMEVPDRKAFLDAVTRTVAKGMIESYSDIKRFGGI